MNGCVIPNPNACSLFDIPYRLGSVSLHGPLPPGHASCYPTNFCFLLLSAQFTGTTSRIFCKPLLLELSAEWCFGIQMWSQMLRELLSWSSGAKNMYFSLAGISPFTVCPSRQGKLDHAELCATVWEIWEMFLMNQSCWVYVFIAPRQRHSHIYIILYIKLPTCVTYRNS